MANIRRGPIAQRTSISSISSRMTGVYFAVFWVQSVVGIAINTYNEIWRSPDNTVPDAVLNSIVESGPISLGAAGNALVVAITVEGFLMVLAAIIKKRQFEEGVEQGIEIGRARERKRVNAKLRALGEEYGIPEDKLPIEDEDEND